MNDQTIRARSSLARERRALRPVVDTKRRVAIIIDRRGRPPAAGGVAETIRQLRRFGVPGHAVELLGGDELDELDHPHDLVHLCAAGAVADAALARAGTLGIPVVAGPGSAPAGCRLILSPTRAADQALLAGGVDPARVARWQPGVDRERFGPARYRANAILPAGPARDAPGGAPFLVLAAGPPGAGAELLAGAILRARQAVPRVRLVLVGDGPAEAEIATRLGAAAVRLGQLGDDELAEVYATAELGVCADPGPAFGHGVLEAQASGLPVLAIEGSGASELVESGRSGCLVAAAPDALGAAIAGLARRATLRERLSTGGLLAVRERTWERSVAALGACWERALAPAAAEVTRAA